MMEAWAAQARSTDPCRHLAIRVILSYEDGSKRTFYPQDNSISAAHKANAVMDWIDGGNDEITVGRPRRFIFIGRKVTDVPLHLQKFVGGGYTDDMGQFFKKFSLSRKGDYNGQAVRPG